MDLISKWLFCSVYMQINFSRDAFQGECQHFVLFSQSSLKKQGFCLWVCFVCLLVFCLTLLCIRLCWAEFYYSKI